MVQLGYRGLDAVLQIDRASVCAPTIRSCWPVKQRSKDPAEVKFKCRVKGMNLTLDDIDVAFAPLSDTADTGINQMPLPFWPFLRNSLIFFIFTPAQIYFRALTRALNTPKNANNGRRKKGR